MITIEEFLRTANQMRDYYAKKIKDGFEEYHFSPNEISILIVLKNNRTITFSTELKIALGVSKALISRSVDSLEKKGLIQVYKDSTDSRVAHLELTSKSQPVLEKVDEEIEKLNKQLFQDISEEEMYIFMQVLNKMRERFKGVLKMKLFMSKEVDLGKEKVSTLLFMLAVPAILSQIVNLLYNIVDRMYIGHIEKVGSLALTGVGVCLPLIMIISAFACLVGMGGAPRASIYMGKQDKETAEKIMGNCFIGLIVISLLLTLILILFQKPLLRLFQASDQTIVYASQYLNIYALGTLFVQMTLGMNSFISCQGFSKISMLTVLIGAILNIVLDPIFIFGFGLEVKGAALATIFSQAVSAIWVFHFLCGDKTILKLKKSNFKIIPSLLFPSLALGIAPFVMQSTESLLSLCFNMQLAKFGGDVAIGTMTILTSVMQFAMMPIQGLTQGGQPIISYNFGAKNASRVQQGFKLQTLFCFGYATLIWLLVELFPSLFIHIFTNDPQFIEMGIWAIRVYMGCVFLMGIQISCQQTFIAFGNAKISIFLACFRKIIVLIPLIFILPLFILNQTFAVFLAEPIADFIAVSTTMTLFYKNFKKTMSYMESNH